MVPGDLPGQQLALFPNRPRWRFLDVGRPVSGSAVPRAAKFEALPPIPFKMGNGFAPLLGDAVLEMAWNGDVIVSSRERPVPVGWKTVEPDRHALRAANTDISAVLADREGSLWVGLAGLGLARWLGYSEWESWGSAEGLPDEMPIWSIHRDAAGTMWVGTRAGLAFARGGPDSPTRWTARPEFAGRMILSLAHSRDNSLWMGTATAG